MKLNYKKQHDGSYLLKLPNGNYSIIKVKDKWRVIDPWERKSKEVDFDIALRIVRQNVEMLYDKEVWL